MLELISTHKLKHLESLKIATVLLRVELVNHGNRCEPQLSDPWLTLQFLYFPESKWMTHLTGTSEELALRDIGGWCWMPIPEPLLEARHKGHHELWPSIKKGQRKWPTGVRTKYTNWSKTKEQKAAGVPCLSPLFATVTAFLFLFQCSSLSHSLSDPRMCTFGDLC